MEKDRLARLLRGIIGADGIYSFDAVADAILADGWVRIGDADLEAAGNVLYAGRLSDSYETWFSSALAAAFERTD